MNPISGSNNRIARRDYYEYHKGVVFDQSVRVCPNICNNLVNANDRICSQCLAKERLAQIAGMVLIPLMVLSLVYMKTNEFVLDLGFEGETATVLTWVFLFLEVLLVGFVGYKLAKPTDE